jgi:hypothetical protein
MEPHTLENPCRSTPSKSEGHQGHGVKTGSVPTLAGRSPAGPPKGRRHFILALAKGHQKGLRSTVGAADRPRASDPGPCSIVRMTRGQAR